MTEPPHQTGSGNSASTAAAELLTISDAGRVRTLTLNRPEALNAFSEALYDALAVAIIDAARAESVAVVVLTGAGRAFSAGNDLADMQARFTDPDYRPGVYGFEGMIQALVEFPKPFICAVNGIGVGVGTTILGHADLVFMSSTARLQCPFTKLGVAPEASSSYLMPQLLGRQNAAWLLMSSEWIDAEQALDMGLVWKVCQPEDLLPTVRAACRDPGGQADRQFDGSQADDCRSAVAPHSRGQRSRDRGVLRAARATRQRRCAERLRAAISMTEFAG